MSKLKDIRRKVLYPQEPEKHDAIMTAMGVAMFSVLNIIGNLILMLTN